MSESKDKNPAAVLLGKMGGVKGGNARAAKLSPERRRQIARVAARARWGGPADRLWGKMYKPKK